MTQNMTDPVEISPALPNPEDLQELREQASDVALASAALERSVAPETALAVGEKLRLLNSYYSNLIEGHKTYIPDIERAMRKEYSSDDAARYAQELCAAHVIVERNLMAEVDATHPNVSDPAFLAKIHKSFYEQLPVEHQFTHEEGFTKHPVRPGEFRDCLIGINKGKILLGPEPDRLRQTLEEFGKIYNPASFKGSEEKLVAASMAHLKLGWIHPFRDGNGRVTRLYTGFFLARCGINKANLWSASRGFSGAKAEYMSNLFASNPQPSPGNRDKLQFLSGNVTYFAEFFLETCKDQIDFMSKQLDLKNVAEKIDIYVANRREVDPAFKPESARLLRAAFATGALERGQAYGLLGNLGERTAQRLVKEMLDEGLLESKGHKAPLTFGLPEHAISHYFPNVYNIQNMGLEGTRRANTYKPGQESIQKQEQPTKAPASPEEIMLAERDRLLAVAEAAKKAGPGQFKERMEAERKARDVEAAYVKTLSPADQFKYKQRQRQTKSRGR